MPQLQRTIDGELVAPTAETTAASVSPIDRERPALIYCGCGCEATAETAAGSVCDSCYTDDVACEDCGDMIDPAATEERGGRTVCAGCNDHYSCCESCSDDVHDDDSHCVGNSIYCESCRDNNCFRCDGCREWHENDECNSDDSASYCNDCFEEMSRCDHCNNIYSNDSMMSCGDNSYCESCYSDNCFHCDGCSESHDNDDYARCGHCQSCWDDLDDDARADLIVEVERPARIEYRDRPVAPAAPVNPVITNRPSSAGCCESRPFYPISNGCIKTGSYRTYGVELETSSCPGAADLSRRTVFSSSADGSIDGWEFNSEVLAGDAGLDEIERFCELAEENSFAVDSKCGFHAHFNVADLSDEQRYNVAFAYYYFRDVWTAFVSEARRNRHYCAALKWRPVVYAGTINRIERDNGNSYDVRTTSFREFAGCIDRYAWFNVKSYIEHGTIELRLHSGTISAKKVNFWIIAHLRFIEFVSNLSREAIVREFHGKAATTLFAGLLELMPADVATYLTERAAQFGTTLSNEAPVTSDCDSNMALAS